ncbi:hypothetical protein BDY21DRAFT_340179, partial [Lineolata rhizophorae]
MLLEGAVTLPELDKHRERLCQQQARPAADPTPRCGEAARWPLAVLVALARRSYLDAVRVSMSTWWL